MSVQKAMQLRLGVILAAQFILAAAGLAQALDELRMGLIITNQYYANKDVKGVADLTHAHKDGDVMEAALIEAGFDIPASRRIRDANKEKMEEAINKFAEETALAREKNSGKRIVSFFYYSGHGASDAREGYLIPHGAPVMVSEDLKEKAVPTLIIVSRLESARVDSFIVFDACRNVLRETQFKGLRPIRQMNDPGQALVAYATGEGEVAQDNHVYAATLAERISRRVHHESNHPVVFNDVAVDVKSKTKQHAFYVPGSIQSFYFTPSGKQPAPPSLGGNPDNRLTVPTVWSVLQTRENAKLYFPRNTTIFKDPSLSASHLGVMSAGTTLFDTTVMLGEIGNEQWFQFKTIQGVTAYVRVGTPIMFDGTLRPSR